MPEPLARSGGLTIEGGLRERSKARKLGNIRRAARELFIEKGYDATTTRARSPFSTVAIFDGSISWLGRSAAYTP